MSKKDKAHLFNLAAWAVAIGLTVPMRSDGMDVFTAALMALSWWIALVLGEIMGARIEQISTEEERSKEVKS